MTDRNTHTQSHDPERRRQMVEVIGSSMRKIHPVKAASDLPDDMRHLLQKLEAALDSEGTG